MAPKASLSAKTAQFERFFKVPVHNGLTYRAIKNVYISANIWQKVEILGGFEILTLLQKRTFICLVMCYYSLMRFDCIKNSKLSDIEVGADYIKVNIPKSKTDQLSAGQTAFIVSNANRHNPVVLVCEYVHYIRRHFGEKEFFILPPLRYRKSLKDWIFVPEKQKSYQTSSKEIF